MKDPLAVTVTLSSHTNVGKTTLLRTLLRRDVGAVLDQSHVTEVNEAHIWVERDGRVLRLWDTPGFGDSAKLLKRLRQQQDKPLRWLLGQTFDRFKDRPLWCSQQAIRNLREDADVVLYLVNAAERPDESGYLAWEMQILQFLAKPVIVVLNQTGAGRTTLQDEEDERIWRTFLANHPIVRDVLTLDAFARCWVNEGRLLHTIDRQLPPELLPASKLLQTAWREQNLNTFKRAMTALGRQLADSVLDSEPAPEERLLQRIGIHRGEIDEKIAALRQRMVQRLAKRTSATFNDLIAIHGLEGRSARELGALAEGRFSKPERVNESVWTAVGGAVGGAGVGLVADLMHGGLTMGAGTVLGFLGGGAGGYLLAKGFNLSRNAENRLFWSRDHFREQVKLALLCYLAVAHFGRGRGAWSDTELPAFWEQEASRLAEEHHGALDDLWKTAQSKTPDRARLETTATKLSYELVSNLLEALYPGCHEIFTEK